MLTNKAKYGLRALCALARAEGQWLPAGVLAPKAKVPVKFLEAILVELRKSGFIRSRRGKEGGHALVADAHAIRVGDVIRAIDGPLAPVRCASLSDYAPCKDCRDPEHCAVRSLMQEARSALSSVLDQCSLAELASRGDASLELAGARLP